MLSEKRSRILSRFSIDQICFAMLALSICFKLIYAVRVPYNISPHDLNLTSDWTNIPDGHLGYIQYIYQYRQLTDFSPVEYPSQYYHPPLFYILSAVIMSVFDPIKNNNLTASFEAIQFFNMITASVIPVVCYFIFKELKIKGQGLLWATLLVSFSPALYHIGAALNSDCLMSFFLSLFCHGRLHVVLFSLSTYVIRLGVHARVQWEKFFRNIMSHPAYLGVLIDRCSRGRRLDDANKCSIALVKK